MKDHYAVIRGGDSLDYGNMYFEDQDVARYYVVQKFRIIPYRITERQNYLVKDGKRLIAEIIKIPVKKEIVRKTL